MTICNFTNRILVVLLTVVTPISASALVLTIEPDDYAVDTVLSNVSPYVSLYYVSPFEEASNVKAVQGGPLPGVTAPTGSLSFGNYALNLFGPGNSIDGFEGLALRFTQDVQHISLLANSVISGLPSEWVAFSEAGNRITSGSAGHDSASGETFEILINVANVRTVILGGAIGTAAINYDHLTFEILDKDIITVSEPSLLLVIIGLFPLFFSRTRLKRVRIIR